MAKPDTTITDITKTDLYKKLSYLLCDEVLGTIAPADKMINPDANMIKDLGMDDLDDVEYVLILEEEFDLQIDEDTAESFKTLRDVYNFLIKKNIPANYETK